MPLIMTQPFRQKVLAYTAEVEADSPIGWWRLDEADGSVTAVDQTGNTNGEYKGAGLIYEEPSLITEGGNSVTFGTFHGGICKNSQPRSGSYSA